MPGALSFTTTTTLVAALVGTATSTAASDLTQRNTIPANGFFDPKAQDGGYMLTNVPNTFPSGQGEPINVIISDKSDASILVDDGSYTSGGLWTYFLSLDFQTSCLGGLTLGDKQSANLGDGNGYVNETQVMRYNYKDPVRGVCNETTLGGNHFRYWKQNGPDANSSAVFLAVSYELPLAQNHDISPDGYNLGRDWLVGNATGTTFAQPNPFAAQVAAADYASGPAEVPSSQFIGQTSANNFTFQTTARYFKGLLNATSVGINHNGSVPVDGRPAVDGLVAVLEVAYISKPAATASLGVKVTAPQLVVSLAVVFAAVLLSCVTGA